MEKLVYEVRPTCAFAADSLNEWYSEDLGKADGQGKSRFLNDQELQDFYSWTKGFDEDCQIDWTSAQADYLVFENGNQINLAEKF